MSDWFRTVRTGAAVVSRETFFAYYSDNSKAMALSTPDETEQTVERLRSICEYMYSFDYYRGRFRDAGISPDDIDSLGTFRELPTMTPRDLAADYTDNPPWGSMILDDEPVVRCHFTPSPFKDPWLPVPYTSKDIALNERINKNTFTRMGISEDDVVLNTMNFAPYLSGWAAKAGAELNGATHLATGPGNTQKQAEIIREYGVTTVYGSPSFLIQLATESDDELPSVERVICTGEPFTAIDGYRERMITAYGGDVTAIDAYGASEFGTRFVAYETPDFEGMYLPTDLVFVEVMDPETGAIVDRGEKGELVLTTLVEESMPVLRLRTGDLTKFDRAEDRYVLPNGVFGRVDNMQKIKGVKVYPMELQMYLAGVDGVDPTQVEFRVIRSDEGTDEFTCIISGDSQEINKQDLRDGLQSVTNIAIDRLEIDDTYDTAEEGLIVETHE